MVWTRRLIGVLAILAAGCATPDVGKDTPTAHPGARTLEAVRAQRPPTIDGKLDDPCWQEIEPVTGFLLHCTQAPAGHQAFGYVCYDDSHLYIGMKCLVPEGAVIKGEKRVHDSNRIFGDEIVEIMIDPGRSLRDYYQLVLSAHNATFDCSRTKAGKHEDDAWNGEWEGKAHIGDGYWSAELAVPYHNLGVTAETGSTWGINLCRESPATKELSTLGADGMFNHAWTFAAANGLDVDFRKYAFPIGPEEVALDVHATTPQAVLTIPVANRSGASRAVSIERCYVGPAGQDMSERRSVELADGQVFRWQCESLALTPMMPGRNDVFDVRGRPNTRKVVVHDAATDTVLSAALIKSPANIHAMKLDAHTSSRTRSSRKQTSRIDVKVCMSLDATALATGTLEVTLETDHSRKAVDGRLFPKPSSTETVKFSTKNIPWGRYTVRAVFRNAEDREVLSSAAPITVLPGGKYCVRPLNNLVSELMDARQRGLLGEREIVFVNPRDGWVYLDVEADVSPGSRLTASIRGSSPVRDMTVLEGKAGERHEAMCYLGLGKHAVVLGLQGDCEVRNVIVRAIPELVYSRFNSNPHTAPFGPYAGEFQEKHIFDNVNVFVSGGKLDKQQHAKMWLDRGGKWILHCSVPQETEAGRPIDADRAFEHISKTYGYTQRSACGSIADEFGNSQLHCAPYADAVRKLSGTPQFADKRFYPYANNLYNGPEGQKLVQALVDTGGRIAWKRYLKQQPDEAAAKRFLEEHLIETAQQYRELCPGSLEHIIVCFGIFSAPNEFLNTNPEANYRTYLDMQFHTVANAPAFRGVYGLMSYLSSYADEETLRWVAKLFRHYGIEGRTERLTDDPYDLTHLLNGDFARGSESWSFRPAGNGSMRLDKSPGFGWLQGRYPRTAEGDTVLLTTRSAQAPNTFSQTLKDLTPGKLYSFRMFSADFEDMSKKERHAVSIKLDGVELLPEHCFTHQIANCYSHRYGPYDRNHKAWMNYHWRVFRAKGTTATLTVSDWGGNDAPGGRVGQKLMHNYCVVQPYFPPER